MAEIAITVDNLVLRYRHLNNYSIKRRLLSFRQNKKEGKGKKGTFGLTEAQPEDTRDANSAIATAE